jgi:pilus assembly protein FimV
MSHIIQFLLVMVFALGAIQSSVAMQLGTSKGSVVFGRPLDLTIPVRFDAPIEDPFNCFSADIFQADTKFDAGRVRIDVTPASNGLDAVVRIRSNTAVIEPWAKVILRNNCGAKVTRQYDFLTDFAADMPAITSQTESVATNNLPSANIVGNSPAKPNTQTATVSNALPLLPSAPVSNWSVKRVQESAQTTNQASVQASTRPKRTVKPNAVEAKPTALAAAPANPLGKVAQMGQSRLKMETFELSDEHQVLLKLSTAMIAPTGMRTPEEIQALAQATAVWRAINGMPAVAAATVAQQVTPPAITPAVAVQTKPTAIAKDGKHEFNNPIVYGLMGLLALTLACIAWLWFHVRRGTQPGYGWLQEKAMADAPMQTEPAPFMPTSFTETTFVPEAQVDEVAQDAELANTEFEEPPAQLAKAAFDDALWQC